MSISSAQEQTKQVAGSQLQKIRFNQYHKQSRNSIKQKVSRQQAISNIIAYSEKNNNLVEQYNEDFFISYFDRQTIEDLALTIPPHLQMKKDEFIKKLTTFIKHNEDETLFLIISLIGVYKKIKDQTKAENGIKISDFTSHICDKISSLGAQLLIPLKQIPGEKANPNPLKIRNIDLQPPVIFSEVQKQIPQISKSKQKKDKKIDPLKPLSQFFISPSTSLIMTLGSLSSTINIYSMQFQKKKEIYPSCFKALDKKLAILSFAFSEKQQRIGAIINNIGIAFWDFTDHFRTEKLIQRTNVGNKIFYLQLNDQWVTANDDSIIYWDLKDESVKTVIKEEKSKAVNDICEITHIRAIGAAYTMKDQSKWVIIYQPYKKQRKSFAKRSSFMRKQEESYEIEFKRLARVNLSPSGCHTLYYNRFTQIIIPLGYKDTIPLYNIDSQSLDVSLLHELKGHQTIVTSITEIDESDIIFTGDDRGHIIVWTLTDMRCQQLIRVANWINSLKCIGNLLYYGDTRINMIKLEGINIKISNKGNKYLVKNDQSYGIFKSYRSQRNELFIFTRKSCRILSMLNGKTLKIVELCAEDQEILVVENYFNGYIIGTSKGDIYHYSIDFQLKWKLPSAHESDTTELKVDRNNKFFLSNGRDSNIYIWAQKTLQDEGPRKVLMNGEDNIKEEISFTELSEKFGLFITCSYSNEIRVWDYESCKLVHVLQIHHQKSVYPVAIKICEFKPLLFVACSNEVVLIYKFSRKQSILSFKLIAKIDKKILTSQSSQRVEKKKVTGGLFGRGLSILDRYEYENGLQEEKNRYSLSTTLHDIARQNEERLSVANVLFKDSDENKVPQFLVQQILLDMSGNDYKLILAYNKGSIMHLCISVIISENFDSHTEEQFKKSANVQRPIKQSLIKQIYKSQVDRTYFDKKRFNYVFSLDQKYLVWNLKLHKDLITHLDVYQAEYVSTMCLDGYYKLVSLYTGSMICSMNINFPLPIRWDYRPHKNQQFCQKIHEALLLLDQMFVDVQQLTKTQFKALNVRPFLDLICRPKTRAVKQKTLMFKSLIKEMNQSEKQNLQHKNRERSINDNGWSKKPTQKATQSIRNKQVSQSFKVEVLSDEFAPEDLKRTPLHYASLKSYEVYKRVKKFINVRDSEVQMALQQNKSLEMNRKKTQIQERQSIIEFLSPNYLPKLLNKDVLNSLNQKLVLGEKSTAKNVTLTKDDFKKVYDLSNYNSISVMRENSVQRGEKAGSKNKIMLEKISDPILQKKMQSTGFEFGPKKFSSNQSSLASLNRSQLQNIMNLTNASLKMSKTNLMKQLCDKTHEFKKVHKIIKI